MDKLSVWSVFLRNFPERLPSVITNLLIVSFISTIIFVVWSLSTIYKLSKKLHIIEIKHQNELQIIKQLLVDNEVEHVIDLINSNK